MSTSVGFVGLGRMGAPMARNLAAAGHRMTLWNRSPAKAEALAEEIGAEVAATPGALAAAADVVVTMVADGDALEQVYFGEEGFADGLAGGVAVDMSTIGPLKAKELAERLEAQGVRFADAPVSGSTAAASAATLTIMVGAATADFEQLQPLLSAVGEPVVHLGEVGSASLVKLAVNGMIYGINQCLSEALVLAERGGVDPEQTYRVILESAAAAPVVGYRRTSFLEPDTPVTLALELEEKDLRLTTELGEELGAPLPQANLNRRVVRDALEAGFGGRDIASIVQYLREVSPR